MLPSRVFITGSSDGLGLMAGRLLAADGHQVTLHARDKQRADDTHAALPQAQAVVTGDLSTPDGLSQVFAVARRWPGGRSNAVAPGWVPTKMGGSGAPDDMALAPVTQAWLAVSDDFDAQVSGEYLYHQQLAPVHPAAREAVFAGELLDYCAGLSGVQMPGLDLPVPGPAQ